MNLNEQLIEIRDRLEKIQDDTVAIRIQQAVAVEQALVNKKHLRAMWLALIILAGQVFPNIVEPLKHFLGLI